MKTLPVSQSRTVSLSVAQLNQIIAANAAQLVGVKQEDSHGSGTLTSFSQNGNVVSFSFEFAGGMGGLNGNGTATGTVTLVPLGATTTRLDARATVNIDGPASKVPNFVLNKAINKAIDQAIRELTEFNGPAAAGPDLAA